MINLENIGRKVKVGFLVKTALLASVSVAGCAKGIENYFFRIADVNKDGYQDVVAIHKKGFNNPEIFTLYGDKMGVCIPETNKEGKRVDITAWNTDSNLIIWINKERYCIKKNDAGEYSIKNYKKK